MTERDQRTVLITGGTGSVGESLIAGFAREGYQIYFIYHQSERRAQAIAEEFDVTPIKMDLFEPINLVNDKIDILINNAAINDSSELTGDLPLEAWERTIALNLTAPFRLIQMCLPNMVCNNWGRIINISSIYGLRSVETNLPYTVTKHGLSGLTKTIAREYGRYGIRCNEICPGPIKSQLLDRICKQRALVEGVSLADYMREVEEELPTGKLVLPVEVTELAVFLASEACSSINGASLVIDGGMIA